MMNDKKNENMPSRKRFSTEKAKIKFWYAHMAIPFWW